MPRVLMRVTATEPTTLELCEAYWQQNDDDQFAYKVSTLATRFGLPASKVSKLVAANSSAEIAGHTCPRCSAATVIHSRGELGERSRYAPRTCETCRREEAQLQEQSLQAEASARKTELSGKFPVIDEPDTEVSILDLTLAEAFTLAALFEDGDPFSPGVSTPLSTRGIPLAPTRDYEADLVGGLIQNGYLYIHPNSPIEAFVWEGTKYAGRYYPASAKFYLPGSGPLDERVDEFLRDFQSIVKPEAWMETWHAELTDFWTALCVSDCEAYLTNCLSKRSLDLSIGGKTRDAIRRGLGWFTLGQMYYFIWRAAAGAGDYHARGGVNRSQAANSAVTRLAASIDRAYGEAWSIKPYQRGLDEPESMLWHLLAVRSMNLTDPMSFAPALRRRDATSLQWSEIDYEAFERLVFTLVDEASGYEEVRWLMRTNAPDHGRDISAVRLTRDALSGHRQFRVVIQCKHWLSRSVTDKDIANEVVSIEHWENPPFDVLVVATSGRFTADAVTWMERHNAKGHRPYVELWSDAHLESLLSERQHLIVAFRLR